MAKRAASTAAKPRRSTTRSRAAAPPPAAPDIEYGTEYIDDAPEYRPEPQYADPVQEYPQRYAEPFRDTYPEEYPEEYPVPHISDAVGPPMTFFQKFIVGLAVWFVVMASILMVVGVWWWLASGDAPEPDKPAPSAPAELIAQVDRATAGPEQEKAATYLGKFCRGLGNQLRTDAKNEPSDYDTKNELAAIVGIALNRFTSSDQTKAYRDLPKVFEDMQRRAFGDDPMAGPATKADVLRFADEWTTLGDAFLAVAE